MSGVPAHSAPRRAARVNDQALTNAQQAALRLADRQAQSDQGMERARAAARLRALELELQRRQDQAELHAGLDETLGLARARGETVEDLAGAGQRRIRIASRDGLETLARSGAIDNRQFRAGMLYRDLYEAVDPERDLRSQLASPTFLGGGSAKASAGPPETWAERRLRLSGAISRLEAKVGVADPSGRALRALREVAGHARCLSHFVSGGGAQAAHREALILALDVAARHFALD